MNQSKVDAFSLLIKQHNLIKDVITEALKGLELVKTQATEADYLDLILKLNHVKQLLLEHGEYEEEELLPLLKKIYSSEEMAHYIKDEHIQLETELTGLTRLVREHAKAHKECLDKPVYFKIKKFLDQMVVHIFEEESSLFPMLKALSNQG